MARKHRRNRDVSPHPELTISSNPHRHRDTRPTPLYDREPHEAAALPTTTQKPIVLPKLPYSQYTHKILLCDTKDPVHVNNILTWWMLWEEFKDRTYGDSAASARYRSITSIADYNGSWTQRKPCSNATVLVFLPEFFADGTSLVGWGVPTSERETGLVKEVEWQVPGMHIDECYLQLLEAGKMEERKSLNVGEEEHRRIYEAAAKDVMREYTMRWALGAPVRPVGLLE